MMMTMLYDDDGDEDEDNDNHMDHYSRHHK